MKQSAQMIAEKLKFFWFCVNLGGKSTSASSLRI